MQEFIPCSKILLPTNEVGERYCFHVCLSFFAQEGGEGKVPCTGPGPNRLCTGPCPHHLFDMFNLVQQRIIVKKVPAPHPTCSNLFELDLTVQVPTTSWTCSNLFMMKHGQSESEWLAFDWNAFSFYPVLRRDHLNWGALNKLWTWYSW